MWLAVLSVWGSTALAISIAIYYTHDMRCLWFLLIPAMMSFHKDEKKDKEDKNEPSDREIKAESEDKI